MKLIFEEVDVIKLPDGTVKELHKSRNESIHNYPNAILIHKYFHAIQVENS
ncbi:hypothetical protein [Neobacillus mesonae]|uniref:hypothetical protein n=1 Tax=Neobacillus mesonae TaxID=1193713 RepID=UPI002572252F|nr:hypothetical protein [Neobacillus mesonae]